MTRRLKDILAFALSAGLCGYAAWRELQFVAVAGFVGALCVVYKSTVVRAAEIALDLLGRLTQAKYGDFEVQVGREAVGAVLAADAPAWVRGVLSCMTANHVGLVLAIHTSGSFKVTGGVLKGLRELRNLGLIEHDHATLAASPQVWLSALGEDVAEYLRGTVGRSEGPSNSPAAITDPAPSNKPLQPTSGTGGLG